MKNYLKALLCGVAAFFTAFAAHADSADAIKAALKKLMPNLQVTEIRPSPVSGVSEVMIGPRLFYVTNDGKYLFQGNLIDVAQKKNVTEQVRRELRADAVEKIGADGMIIFPADKESHHITVFTDIDCGYCRKLHNEVPAFNQKGISVRYLMYPRSGPNTPSYFKAINVWCSKDQQDAMTRAKLGEEIEQKTCKHPIMEHRHLGSLLGVQGTPAIVLEDGEMLPGYVSAVELSRLLEQRKSR